MSKDLHVIYDENGTPTDFTRESREYLRDSFTVNYVTDPNNALYFGLYKPFYNIFMELTAVVENPVLTFEYWNGSAWTALSVIDESNSLKRSGFMKWERELEDWALTTVGSKNKYWVRVRADVNYTAIIDGLNLVFSDDADLIAIERRIMKQLAKGDTSFIAYHVSARDEIMQRYRNSGNTKRKINSVLLEKVHKWDLLDIEDIRQASKFLTMAKIHFDASEQIEDKSYQRYTDYMGLFGDSFSLHLQQIDSNDNGVKDPIENNETRSIEITKL